VYVFAGDGKGAYAAPTTLTFATGKPLTVGSAMHVAATDWDGDGDVDLVIGNIEGGVFFVPNLGTKAKPAWGDPVALRSDPEPKDRPGVLESLFTKTDPPGTVKAPGGDAGPAVVDFDGDGRHDLLLGCGDGSVRFYRNRKAAGPPELERPVEIMAAPKPLKKGEDATAAPRPGVRAKVALGDWNGDGRPDLLLGDFASREGPEPKLTPEQTKEKERLSQEMERAWAEMTPYFERCSKAAEEAAPGAHSKNDEALQEKWNDAYSAAMKALEKEPAYVALQERQKRLQKALDPLEAPRFTEGFVWVRLALPPQKP
jgi:hypothetical protein